MLSFSGFRKNFHRIMADSNEKLFFAGLLRLFLWAFAVLGGVGLKSYVGAPT